MPEPEKPDELDKLEEQEQQEWQARTAQKRLDLSQSIEETLAETSLLEDDWLDEVAELDSLESDLSLVDEFAEQAKVKDTILIPPRLSLQSKPMPAVLPDTPTPPNELAPQQPLPTQSPATDPSSKPRLAGRTTKVLLKAIARTEKLETGEAAISSPAEIPETQVGVTEQAERDSVVQHRKLSGTALFGSGMFKRGQCDVVIENPLVTHSSVVTVMLTSDPGPVVVQYVSLQPQTGFTVHLSASAERDAGFNYCILMEE